MYTREDDEILPARRRGVGRPGAGTRPAPPPAADRPAPRRRSRSLVVEVALTLGALLGVVVTGVTVLAVQTGLRPLVVRSGSMEPTIATGSMVLVRRIDAADIRPGQVVAVERPDRTRVTHRVVSLEHHGETVELTMKGDANEDPDAAPVTVRHADLLVHQVPELGRMAGELATPRGGFLIGCLVTAVAMKVLRRRPRPVPLPVHA
ncbi:MAG: signal peptidase I [Actinomycetota bacterium]